MEIFEAITNKDVSLVSRETIKKWYTDKQETNTGSGMFLKDTAMKEWLEVEVDQ